VPWRTVTATLALVQAARRHEAYWSAAASFAREASPYVHAKLSNVDLNATVKRDAATMADDELMGLLSAEVGQNDPPPRSATPRSAVVNRCRSLAKSWVVAKGIARSGLWVHDAESASAVRTRC
jgi:hypothetical protein